MQFREVKRKANAGDRIKIVSPMWSYGHYKDGDEFTVISHSETASGVYVREHSSFIYDAEYVVLEPVVRSIEVVQIEGRNYRSVDRPVRWGDRYVTPKMKHYVDCLTAGTIYRLGWNEYGHAYIRDDEGNHRFSLILEGDVYVLEPVDELGKPVKDSYEVQEVIQVIKEELETLKEAIFKIERLLDKYEEEEEEDDDTQ